MVYSIIIFFNKLFHIIHSIHTLYSLHLILTYLHHFPQLLKYSTKVFQFLHNIKILFTFINSPI
nr:MAG TPA: hypothetical protein [Caudoviricetes sp.]